MEKGKQVILRNLCSGVLIALIMVHCSGTRPQHVAEGHDKLAPCPETSNCVSTQAKDEKHRILPLTYSTDTKTAMRILKDVIQTMKRTEIIAEQEDYLYAEFISGFWRFVDDVEFSFDVDNKLIHFRSASRLGKGDFGVNRKRMEKITLLFNERMKVVSE